MRHLAEAALIIIFFYIFFKIVMGIWGFINKLIGAGIDQVIK